MPLNKEKLIEELKNEIARRQLSENELKKSKELLSQLLEAMPCPVFFKDAHGHYSLCNKEFADYLGHPAAEIIGRTVFDVAPPELAKIYHDSDFNLFQPGHKELYETRVSHADGTLHDVLFYKSLIKAADGNTLGMIGVMLDITRRKQIEETLQTRLHLREYAANHSLDEFLRYVLDKAEQLTQSKIGFFHFLNPDQNNLNLQMWSTNTLKNMCTAEGKGSHYPIDQAGVWIDCIRERKAVIHNDYVKLPHRKGLPPGHAPVIRELTIPVIRDNKIAAIIGVGNKQIDYSQTDAQIVAEFADMVWDIVTIKREEEELRRAHGELERKVAERTTELAQINEELRKEIDHGLQIEQERKKLQLQLFQAQKMEAIGTLAGGIAHDFNNILSPIMISTEMLMMSLPKDDPLYFHLVQILHASKRARELIRQVLDFSRHSEGKKIALKISVIIKEALKMLRSSLPATIEIKQIVNLKNDIIFANPTQIHQILMNLCTNAAQAMKEKGGILVIELTEKLITADTAVSGKEIPVGSYVRLMVSDTGKGMAKEVVNRIYDPYFTTKPRGEGTGLGLSVVHGIVQEHGGTIKVIESSDKGTSFEVLLPQVTDVLKTDQKETSIYEIAKANEHILLVDDEEDLLSSMAEGLETIGYRVTKANNGKNALDIFTRNPDDFALIITDQTMPKMTGAKLADNILKIRPQMPIIIWTGFTEEFDAARARAIGIKEFILKPVELKQLSKIIKNILIMAGSNNG